MKTKKKLLIALLSATCLTAGAFAMTACHKDKESDTRNQEIVAIYNAYAESAGDNALSYDEWLASIKGENGKDGQPGAPGATGSSAYQIAVDNGFVGTEEQWLESLKGSSGRGILKVEYSAEDKCIYITYTDSATPVKVELPSELTHIHSYNYDNVEVIIEPTVESKGLGYVYCTDADCTHAELVVIPESRYYITVYLPDGVTPAVGATVTVNGVTAVTDNSGVAELAVGNGVYTISASLTGYGYYANDKTGADQNMSITLSDKYYSGTGTSASPYTISSAGTYGVSVSYTYNTDGLYTVTPKYIRLNSTAPVTYKLTVNSDIGTLNTDAAYDYDEDSNSYSFYVAAAATDSFTADLDVVGIYGVLPQENGSYYYTITVEQLAPPAEGSIKQLPAPITTPTFTIAEPGTYYYTAVPSNISGAGFTSSVSKLCLTFDGDDAEVIYFGRNTSSTGALLASGEGAALDSLYSIYGTYYFQITTTEANVDFTIAPYVALGSTFDNALTLDLDGNYSYVTAESNPEYYVFTAEEAGTYVLSLLTGSYYYVYDADRQAIVSYESGLSTLELSAGDKIYLAIYSSGAYGFEFSKETAESMAQKYPGRFASTAINVNDSLVDGKYSLPLPYTENGSDYLYLTYTVEEDGNLTITTDLEYYVYVANETWDNTWSYAVNKYKNAEVKAGDVIRLIVPSYVADYYDSDKLAIVFSADNGEEEVPPEDTLTVTEITKAGEVNVENATADEPAYYQISVVEGQYWTITSENAEIKYGTITDNVFTEGVRGDTSVLAQTVWIAVTPINADAAVSFTVINIEDTLATIDGEGEYTATGSTYNDAVIYKFTVPTGQIWSLSGSAAYLVVGEFTGSDVYEDDTLDVTNLTAGTYYLAVYADVDGDTDVSFTVGVETIKNVFTVTLNGVAAPAGVEFALYEPNGYYQDGTPAGWKASGTTYTTDENGQFSFDWASGYYKIVLVTSDYTMDDVVLSADTYAYTLTIAEKTYPVYVLGDTQQFTFETDKTKGWYEAQITVDTAGTYKIVITSDNTMFFNAATLTLSVDGTQVLSNAKSGNFHLDAGTSILTIGSDLGFGLVANVTITFVSADPVNPEPDPEPDPEPYVESTDLVGEHRFSSGLSYEVTQSGTYVITTDYSDGFNDPTVRDANGDRVDIYSGDIYELSDDFFTITIQLEAGWTIYVEAYGDASETDTFTVTKIGNAMEGSGTQEDPYVISTNGTITENVTPAGVNYIYTAEADGKLKVSIANAEDEATTVEVSFGGKTYDVFNGGELEEIELNVTAGDEVTIYVWYCDLSTTLAANGEVGFVVIFTASDEGGTTTPDDGSTDEEEPEYVESTDLVGEHRFSSGLSYEVTQSGTYVITTDYSDGFNDPTVRDANGDRVDIYSGDIYELSDDYFTITIQLEAGWTIYVEAFVNMGDKLPETETFTVTMTASSSTDEGDEGGTTTPDDGSEEAEPATASFLVPLAGSLENVPTETVTKGTDIADNDLFTATAAVNLAYSAGNAYNNLQTASHAVSYTDISGETHNPDQGIKLNSNIAAAEVGEDGTTTYSSADAITVTAKEDITVYIYVTFTNDSYNSNRTGEYYYSIDGGEKTTVESNSERATVSVIKVDLKAGETLTLGATNTTATSTTSTAKLWLFGIEAVESND